MGKRRSGMASGDTPRNRRRTASTEANESPNKAVAAPLRKSSARGGCNNVSAGASPRARPPPSASALSKAVEVQRLQLVRVQAVVLGNISILRDSYGLEMGGIDICYCCEVVRDMLERVMTNLDTFRTIVGSDDESSLPLDALALARIIGVPRYELFRAQSVTRLIARVLKDDRKDSYEASLRVVFVVLGDMLDETIAQLEPMNLGLPAREFA
jgi:hypothetical protein